MCVWSGVGGKEGRWRPNNVRSHTQFIIHLLTRLIAEPPNGHRWEKTPKIANSNFKTTDFVVCKIPYFGNAWPCRLTMPDQEQFNVRTALTTVKCLSSRLGNMKIVLSHSLEIFTVEAFLDRVSATTAPPCKSSIWVGCSIMLDPVGLTQNHHTSFFMSWKESDSDIKSPWWFTHMQVILLIIMSCA